ncbi:hypothetical protein QUF75_03860 [Desulfococcaceae bacterium HSG7]|nr:hypothetical protein [Desulfococcaceae bacterium HSG7]
MTHTEKNNLPDTTDWEPRANKVCTLQSTFLQTCRAIEARIIAETTIEKSFNIDNFDSGPGVEDFCRSQVQILLPDRYTALSAVVSDQQGRTCGECDIVIANKTWFPFLKYGVTGQSRRVHIPVEGVYSILEIKQTLTRNTLEEAMRKIVLYKRLIRKRSEYGRIIENHNLGSLDDPTNSLNYRFDAIVAVFCATDASEMLIQRFFAINESLPPKDRVNCLALLGHGYACYVKKTEDERNEHLYPEQTPELARPYFLPTPTDAFYRLWINLWYHLTLTVLNPAGIKYAYGARSMKNGKFLNE